MYCMWQNFLCKTLYHKKRTKGIKMAFKTGVHSNKTYDQTFVETYKIWNIWHLKYVFNSEEYLACTSVKRYARIRATSLQELKSILDTRIK